MKKVKIKFQNGIDYDIATREILSDLLEEYEFIESDHPDFILFGPYGNDLPPKGNYIRIGYFCENIKPAVDCCEWSFGVPSEDIVNHPNYKRIQWHGLNPNSLLKHLDDNQIDQIISSKAKFCNFLYSHPVTYREDFFDQLSKYKRVDAAGKSRNNMPSIDQLYEGNIWERKRKFISEYKFTIAFENYSYPGYQTEKLYDAMQENSIPIYCGDPFIDKVFNTNSFLNAKNYVELNDGWNVKFLEDFSQMDFVDIRPQYFNSPYHRLKRKVKFLGRELKMKLQFDKLDFSNLIEKIVEIDKDPNLYYNYLKQPWLKDNAIPEALSTKKRWQQIFNSN